MKCLPGPSVRWLAPCLGALALIGCQENVPNTVPSFGDRTIANQVYTAGEAISPLTLPSASGGEGDLSYSLEPIPAGLAFDAAQRRLSGTPTAPSTYLMTYEVEDKDADSDELTFTITVLAPAPSDTAPSFTGTVQDQRYTVGTTIELLTLPPATGGNGTLTYSLEPVPPGLLFSEFLRFLAGAPSTAGTYEVEYRVEDADANTADSDADTLSFTIVVEETTSPDTAPSFTGTVADQTYTKGEAIRPLTLPSASGGEGTLTYSLQPVPPGLTFDGAARVLSGTPTVAGRYRMTYTVEDEDTDSAVLTFAIRVNEQPVSDTEPSFGAQGIANQTYTVGTTITPLVLPAATGGDSPLTYSLTPTVPGLEFVATTRTLRGTPSTAGTHSMTYHVRDRDGDAAMLTFAIRVSNGNTQDPALRTHCVNVENLRAPYLISFDWRRWEWDFVNSCGESVRVRWFTRSPTIEWSGYAWTLDVGERERRSGQWSQPSNPPNPITVWCAWVGTNSDPCHRENDYRTNPANWREIHY